MSEITDRKIPVWALAARSYQELAKHPAAAARIIGGWVALYTVVFLAWFYGVVYLLATDLEFSAWFDSASARLQDLVATAAPILVALVAIPSVAVAWHRFMLLSEQTHVPIPFNAARVAQYAMRVIATLGLLALFAMLVLPMIGGVFAPLSRLPGGSVLVAIIPLVIFTAGFYLFARLGLSLPGAAIADENWTMEHSWQATDGAGWQLVGATLLVTAPIMVVRYFFAILAAAFADTPLIFIALCAVGEAAALVSVVLGASFYSLVFEFVTQGDGAKDRPPVSHFT